MDESRDEQFEVLDVGGRRRDRDRTDADLPPIRLQDEPPEPRGDRTPGWRQAAGVFGAMVLAVVATALVMDARDEAADAAAAAEAVHLIVGELQDRQGVDPDETTALLEVTVHNAGPRDIDVLSIHPKGWSISPDHDPDVRTVVAGEWTAVPMYVVPSCDGPTPTTLEAEIRTEAGVQAVTLDRGRSGYSPLQWIRDTLCQSALEHARVWMWVMDAEVLPDNSDSLLMRLFVQADPTDSVVITEVTTRTSGFDVEVVDAPATLTQDPSARGVDVAWSVSDCGDATAFDNADIQFQVKGNVPVDSEPTLPNAAVAALARYALAVCDA